NRKVYRDYWWQYAEKRPAMINAIKELDRVLVVARVSRTAMATIVPTGQVLNEKIVLFVSDRVDVMALLNSSIHVLWAWKYSATLKSDLQYTPSDCFETFPMPQHLPLLESPGKDLSETRTAVMRNREYGLTKLYNLVNDPQVSASDVNKLRECHKVIDEAVAEAYEWGDLDLGHGFHETRNGVRFTVSPVAQNEILDRLLELNHTRFNQAADTASHERLGRSPVRDNERVVAPHGDTLF
ncbi:type IIL restriction-modification enzyme MmeI, partial [Streptomyces sp. NPDC002817]|uniref:type IIL restriction-modification enzyme MmeI n=1 Tax=Streptomyces sp. NPDC088357 TaxID=3154655 RepID=UPI0034411A30